MTTNSHERIHIGTSGWHYEHWVGPFYPQNMPESLFLTHYAQRLATVEINNSFYQLPAKETVIQWQETAPAGFCFAVKASRYITHMKKLTDPAEPVAGFIERMSLLGDKLGPILFQLPPRWHVNVQRLRDFLQVLPAGYRYAFEFRDPSWFDPQVYTALADRDAAFCIYHLDGRLSPKTITTDLIYVRLHGPDGPYQGCYDTPTLAGWAGAFATWHRQGKEIYCYFDNDQAGHAVQNARQLQEMIAGA
jgi:uncharacterized protein YecE (DUF72 family)